jgi:hypothetical protein
MIKSLEKMTLEKEVKSREDRNFKFNFPMSEFAEFLDENISVRFSLCAKVKETGQAFVTQKVCNIMKPDLKVELIDNEGGEVTEGDEMKVKITIPKCGGIKKYSQATLMIDTGLEIAERNIELKDTEANSHSGFIEKTFKIGNMEKNKQCSFNVTFNAYEISGIHGSLTVDYKAQEVDVDECFWCDIKNLFL